MTISFSPTVTLLASVSGGSVEQVTFTITQKTGGTYTKTLTDNNGSNGWSQSWTSDGVTSGQYEISVSAISGGNTITGNSVTVNY